MFLFHILSRKESELVRKVYEAQRLKPVLHDWYDMIKSEKEKYNINLSDHEIQCLSKNRFKKIVNEKVNQYALSKLISKAQNQFKCRQIVEQIDIRNKLSWLEMAPIHGVKDLWVKRGK